MVVGSPEAWCSVYVYFNQSRNREWGKEGEGVMLLSGVGCDAGCIWVISRFHVGWQ